jgi:formylmethanofuran dehydrogenase subunit B
MTPEPSRKGLIGHNHGIYTHVMPAAQQEAAHQMEKALRRPVAVKTAVKAAAKVLARAKNPYGAQRARRDSNPQPSDP